MTASGSPLYGVELAPGAMVGPFVIEELCHRGSLANLYRGRRDRTDQRAAVKVLNPQFSNSAKTLRRFQQEADALRRLFHPNIVEILESGVLPDGRPYFATEWIDGRTLAAEIQHRGLFSPREAVAVMEQVGSALAAAHGIGIVHRDLKAQNVMMPQRDEGFAIKLLDFGVAKWLDWSGGGSPGLTSTGMLLGSPISMAPEQIRGEPTDVRTDIYALGVLLHQLLTGQPPFRGTSTIEVEEMHLHTPPPKPSDLVPAAVAFNEIVLRCLEKKPSERFESVPVLLAELQNALHFKEEERGSSSSQQAAIGLYLEVGAPDCEDQAQQELWWNRAEQALESARRACADENFAMAVEGGNSFLAIQALPPAASDQVEGRRLAIAGASKLLGKLKTLSPELTVTVLLHLGARSDAAARHLADPDDGGLLALSEWLPADCGPGLFVSAPMLRGLEEQFATQASIVSPAFLQVAGLRRDELGEKH